MPIPSSTSPRERERERTRTDGIGGEGGVQRGPWILRSLADRIERHALARGVPLTFVDGHGTSRRCHQCGAAGDRGGAVFTCPADDCSVGAVDVDANAAAVLASLAGRIEA